jgi:hypothetical protein
LAFRTPRVVVYGYAELIFIIWAPDALVIANAPPAVDTLPNCEPTLAVRTTALAVISDTPTLEFERIRITLGYVACAMLYKAWVSTYVPLVTVVVVFETLYVHVCTPSKPTKKL